MNGMVALRQRSRGRRNARRFDKRGRESYIAAAECFEQGGPSRGGLPRKEAAAYPSRRVIAAAWRAEEARPSLRRFGVPVDPVSRRQTIFPPAPRRHSERRGNSLHGQEGI